VLGTSRVKRWRAGLGGERRGYHRAILPALIDKLARRPRAARASASWAGRFRRRRTGAEKADFSNVQAGSSSTAPAPAHRSSGTVAPGDSSKIAKRYYGDAQQWRRIYDANREQVKNPDLIQPGWKLRIPAAAQKRD
jgi:nucleoid-associated protein YgaU